LRILTARPTEEEEARAPHRLYGTMSGSEPCSAGTWLRYAKMEIDWALSQNMTPIVTGGTGFYIRALMEGIAEVPEIDAAVRAQAASDYEAMGKDAFAERLRAVDPEFFTRLKVYDKQRLIRAYEVWLGTGKSLSWWQKQGATPPYARERFEVMKVELPREELYRRCDARFLKMIEQGAVEEVRGIWGCGDVEMMRWGDPRSISVTTPSRPSAFAKASADTSATLPPLGEMRGLYLHITPSPHLIIS
jgi:tRNA dimethylallyltransferase